ncbi:MAG: hypothetical protein VYC40_02910, partial [Pseudomonadota bacterium]|nr:hypothetical protein [Pseudomonadota bacterium]
MMIKAVSHFVLSLIVGLGLVLAPATYAENFALNIYKENNRGCGNVGDDRVETAMKKGWMYAGYLFHMFLDGNYTYDSTSPTWSSSSTGDRLFGLAECDISYCTMQRIFGYVPGLLYVSNGVNCGTGGPSSTKPIITEATVGIIRNLNYGFLAILYVMISFGVFNAVLVGGYEGSFTERHLSLIAMTRMCASAILLIPTQSGYSMMQILVMYVILNGVGFADRAFSSAMRQYVKMSSFMQYDLSDTTKAENLKKEATMEANKAFMTNTNTKKPLTLIPYMACGHFYKISDLIDEANSRGETFRMQASAQAMYGTGGPWISSASQEGDKIRFSIQYDCLNVMSMQGSKAQDYRLALDIVGYNALNSAYQYYRKERLNNINQNQISIFDPQIETSMATRSIERVNQCLKGLVISEPLTVKNINAVGQLAGVVQNYGGAIPIGDCRVVSSNEANRIGQLNVPGRKSFIETHEAGVIDKAIRRGIGWDTGPASVTEGASLALKCNLVTATTELNGKTYSKCIADYAQYLTNMLGSYSDVSI